MRKLEFLRTILCLSFKMRQKCERQKQGTRLSKCKCVCAKLSDHAINELNDTKCVVRVRERERERQRWSKSIQAAERHERSVCVAKVSQPNSVYCLQ